MRNKKLLSWGYLLCLIFSILVLWNCEDQEISIEEENALSKTLPFTSLPHNLFADLKKIQERNKQTKTEGLEVFVVDQSQVISTIDSLGNVNYSIKLSFENQPENVLYNLILRTDQSGNSLDPYAMKYTISNLSSIQTEDYVDLTQMNATIDIYFIDTFLEYIDNYLSRSDTTCPDDSMTYGGGDIENPDDSGTTGGETDDCNINVWSNGETGDIHTITWSCPDSGQGGSIDLRTTNCPDNTSTSGGTGINQGAGCPSGMVQDANGVCLCPGSGMVYSGGQCICPQGFVEDYLGNCVNPCDNVRSLFNTVEMQQKVDYLKGRLNKTKESGYSQKKDGTYTQLAPNTTGHSLDVNGLSTLKGYIHTHLNPFGNLQPILMFSPKDVDTFLKIVKYSGGDPNVYGTMVTSKGTYTLKFTGDYTRLPDNEFDMLGLNRKFKRLMKGILTRKGREARFLKFVRDEMGVNGVQLYKHNSDGTLELKRLENSDNSVTSEPC
jgi:hypothetical protein